MENKLRASISDRILQTRKKHVIVEAGTGVGKSKIALDKIHSLYTPDSSILIVIPRNVLIDNWRKEFQKWHYEYMLPNVTFTTYVSLPKHAGHWDIVCFDEAHHLSERCREALGSFTAGCSIYLSATLRRDVRDFIYSKYGAVNIENVKVSTRKAIEEDILPNPEIILIPLELDNRRADIIYEKRKPKNNAKPLVVSYSEKWKYRGYKGALSYRCTQRQYYNEISGLIEWYKGRNCNPAMKTIWLHKCGQRLQWLSMVKLPYTMQIIKKMHSRFVVFCNTITESSVLHIPAVNSQIGFKNLDRFNDRLIDRLVAVNCLNEGINLVDCQVGIFNAINASEVMQTQKVGRELRHTAPVIIIPYFRNTREEEIVNKWMQNFDKSLITTKTIEEL